MMILEKYKIKTFESSTAFFKATGTQIKRDESNFQSLTKVLYHQKPFQLICFLKYHYLPMTACWLH